MRGKKALSMAAKIAKNGCPIVWYMEMTSKILQ